MKSFGPLLILAGVVAGVVWWLVRNAGERPQAGTPEAAGGVLTFGNIGHGVILVQG